MGFADYTNYNILSVSKISDKGSFIPKVEMNHDILVIRQLIENDINQIVLARKCQEEENKNGATSEYLKQYAIIVKSLLEQRKLIAAGAFKESELVSLAFFNLISFGNEKKIPYLCGVWTKPQYRGKGIATKVNDKLLEGVLERKDEMQGSLLLTVEGTESAYNLYKKEGYKKKDGEMSFIGDLSNPYFSEEIKIAEIEEECTNRMSFTSNNVEQMQIVYSKEQFFSHPQNITGKMCRILQMCISNPDLTLQQLQTYLQYFFSRNRFCKFNVNELLSKKGELLKVFGITQEESGSLLDGFENLVFTDINGQNINIKRSESVMENTIQNALQRNLSTEYCH